MNKQELVQQIAQQTGLSMKDSSAAVDVIVSAIGGCLKAGDRVLIAGFGSWEVRARNARTGVNPKTGEKLQIAARNVPRFNPGKELKSLVE